MRFFLICLAFLLPSLAQAQEVDAQVVDAIAAADDGEWDTAYALVGDDAVARDVVTWLRLRDGDGVLADYVGFTASRSDWPGMDRVFARGEEAIEKGAPADQVIAFFAGRMPETGEGAVRLAEALMTTGQRDRAVAVLREVWASSRISDRAQEEMIAGFGDILAPDHVARTDALLWRWRTEDAARMLPLLDDDQRALAQARIAYIRKSGGIADKVAAVPVALLDNPGLAYDRYNWLADTGERTEAIKILLARSTSAEALGDPFRWSGWRRSLARWEMREGRAAQAYELASKHFLTEGDSFADLEWLSGYISLTYLDKPEQALAHFRAAEADVSSPISEGRAGYWIGRSYAAMGDATNAAAAYQGAAQHQTGFYGLLAAEKLGLSMDPKLTGADDATDWQEAAVFDTDLARAAFMLLAGGERGAAVLFFAELGQRLDATELAQVGAYLAELGETYYEVLLGKTAVRRDILVPSIYFPIHEMAQLDLPAPIELALSIARRESEFNVGVGSPVGALGLMQLMPATAEEVAGFLGEPYSKPQLTSDWQYNARLGARYLQELIDEFGYSPVMVAAGYNAGPSRPRQWMDERGDPRIGGADVVDWIEHIPFRETRNYVMRVTESIPVYHARLTGEVGPIQFTRLLNGEKPLVRPLARPEVVEQSPVPVETGSAIDLPASAIAAPAVPGGPAAVQGVRPISRPGG